MAVVHFVLQSVLCFLDLLWQLTSLECAMLSILKSYNDFLCELTLLVCTLQSKCYIAFYLAPQYVGVHCET